MKLLVLGGTVFLGRAIARQAHEAGHEVLCAARGESGEVPAGVRLVKVDRDDPDGLSVLDGERFDAVIDVSRTPSHVRRAVDSLGVRAGHWVFVSTCSVYADQSTPGQQVSTAPTVDAAPPEIDDGNGEHYGPCKVACEQAVLGGPVPSMICRAGLIVGPEDDSGRFDYWVSRLAAGGEVLAPGSRDDRVQWVDVRDLAAWLISAAENKLTGIFDGIGAPVSRESMLAGIASGIGVDPSLTWVPQEFLVEQEVNPWFGERSLPMWLPLPEYAGFLTRDVSASMEAGLRTRPVAETARDTLAWLATTPADRKIKTGLESADEAELLRRWHLRSS